MSDEPKDEIDTGQTGVKIEAKSEPEPLSTKQKFIAECNAIAMAVIQEKVKDGALDWSFEGRRSLERAIEKRIHREVFFAPQYTPRIRLIRDPKSGLVSLDVKPPAKRPWKAKLKKGDK